MFEAWPGLLAQSGFAFKSAAGVNAAACPLGVNGIHFRRSFSRDELESCG